MSYQASTNHETITVQLSSEMVAVATKRAKAMGMDVSEYVAHILNDELKDPWRQPLPAEVEARYEEDYQAFLEEEKEGKRPTYHSVEEYIKSATS